MTRYKIGNLEVEAWTFDEFSGSIAEFAKDLHPRSNGNSCFSINVGSGRTYFSRDEVLVKTGQGKYIVFPKEEFYSTAAAL